jgi:glycosyltransferase involved in cell wall biosynthesis
LVFLIRAMKKVVDEDKEAVLVCVGGTPDWLGKNNYWSELKSEIRRNGLEGRVLLLDKVPNHELPKYYSA